MLADLNLSVCQLLLCYSFREEEDVKIHAQWVPVACNDCNLSSTELIPSQVRKKQGTFLLETFTGVWQKVAGCHCERG